MAQVSSPQTPSRSGDANCVCCGPGVGRRLLKELEACAQSGGARIAHIETSAVLTEALALYRSPAGLRSLRSTTSLSRTTGSRSRWTNGTSAWRNRIDCGRQQAAT
jgi:hypothetical protein